MHNIVKNGSVKVKRPNKNYNSEPLELQGLNLASRQLLNYGAYKIESASKPKDLLKALRNANPTVQFKNTIIGDSYFDDEESELIDKPDEPLWELSCGKDNCYMLEKSKQ